MSLQLGFPLLLLAAMVQGTILPHLRIFGGQPDLVLLLVLAWAILDREQEGIVWAFVGGLLLDVLSGAPLGLSALPMVPIAYLIGLTEAQVYRGGTVLALLLAVGGALAYHALYLLLLNVLAGYPVAWAMSFWYVTVPSVLFDAILILPILQMLARLYERLHPRHIKL